MVLPQTLVSAAVCGARHWGESGEESPIELTGKGRWQNNDHDQKQVQRGSTAGQGDYR